MVLATLLERTNSNEALSGLKLIKNELFKGNSQGFSILKEISRRYNKSKSVEFCLEDLRVKVENAERHKRLGIIVLDKKEDYSFTVADIDVLKKYLLNTPTLEVRDLDYLDALAAEYGKEVTDKFLPLFTQNEGKVYTYLYILTLMGDKDVFEANLPLARALNIAKARNADGLKKDQIDGDVSYIIKLLSGGYRQTEDEFIPLAELKKYGVTTLGELDTLFTLMRNQINQEIVNLMLINEQAIHIDTLFKIKALTDQLNAKANSVKSETIEDILKTLTEARALIKATGMKNTSPILTNAVAAVASIKATLEEMKAKKVRKYHKRALWKIDKEWGDLLPSAQ